MVTINRSIKGTFFIGEKNPYIGEVNRVRCAETKDESYVDDVNVCFGGEHDLLVVNEIFQKFEAMSGAILCRDIKTKVLGLGEWKDKEEWVLPWVKVVKSFKIFGIQFHQPTTKY